MNVENSGLGIVVLSGPIGAGKSELAERLVAHYGAKIIKTRDLIRKQLPNVPEDRAALQRAGERLDRADGGDWVKNALVRFIEDNVAGPAPSGFFVIDLRVPGQVERYAKPMALPSTTSILTLQTQFWLTVTPSVVRRRKSSNSMKTFGEVRPSVTFDSWRT